MERLSFFARISESLKSWYSYRSRNARSSQNAHGSLGRNTTHLLANLDRAATPAREQHTVARFDLGRNDVPVLVRRAS